MSRRIRISGTVFPYDGNFESSKTTVMDFLQLEKISDQPVSQALIEFSEPKNDDITSIEDGTGKHFGLAYFHYCAENAEIKKGEKFRITFQMAVEASLFYGEALWTDYSKPHPAIEPFRCAMDGSDVYVTLVYKEFDTKTLDFRF